MKRLREGWARLRENPRSGLSLIICLCACALLLGMTMSLIYAASIPMARANRKVNQERCRQLATSFAEVLDTELRQYIADDDSIHYYNEYETKRIWPDTAAKCSEDGRFYNQVNDILEDVTKPNFDPEHPDATLSTFTAPGAADSTLEIRLKKYDGLLVAEAGTISRFAEDIKAENNPKFHSYGAFDYGSSVEGAKAAERNNKFIRYAVKFDVAVTLDPDAFLRSAEYYREDLYEPVYTWHVVNNDSDYTGLNPIPDWMQLNHPAPKEDFRVFWNPDMGQFTDAGGNVVEPLRTIEDFYIYHLDGTEEHIHREWEEEVTISYVYYDEKRPENDPDYFHTTYKHYIPAYEADHGTGGG